MCARVRLILGGGDVLVLCVQHSAFISSPTTCFDGALALWLVWTPVPDSTYILVNKNIERGGRLGAGQRDWKVDSI